MLCKCEVLIFLETLSLIGSPSDYSAGDLITRGSRLTSHVLISSQTLINMEYTWKNDHGCVFSCIECSENLLSKVMCTASDFSLCWLWGLCRIIDHFCNPVASPTSLKSMLVWGYFFLKNDWRAVFGYECFGKALGWHAGKHWETLISSTLDCNQGYNLRSAFKTGIFFHGDNDQWVWNGKD